uniref:Uncharacterized protein n=1 Tax=Amphimedon queenslandica TaxID=400682 RepID=A0A1X7U313_AMPQE
MIISHSFPPISEKKADKIKGGKFIEMNELMPDNAVLKSQWADSGSNTMSMKLREIEDPLSWVFCFLGFLAVMTPDRTAKELAAYGQSIIHLAQRHGGRGWQSYDRLFRQQRAAGSQLPWITSFLASTVFSGGNAKVSCQLCNGVDHDQSSCTFQASLAGTGSSTQPTDSSAKKVRTK